MLILTTTQTKRAEKLTAKAGLSYMDMMKNAGLIAFKYCNKNYSILQKKTVVLCGNGNNAGDGFIIAKKIFESGGDVSVIMCCNAPTTKESAEALVALQGETIEIINLSNNPDTAKDRFDSAEIIIDAVYGTGFRGELSSSISNIFEYINDSSATKISLDIPSGVNADTGQASENHLVADATLTFASLKPAHVNDQSKKSCGHIEILDIGIPKGILYMVKNNAVLLTQEKIAVSMPRRHQNTHKGNYGKLLNISGSRVMGGAAMMSTLSAMRMGAGVTTLATPECVANMFAGQMMEAMTLPLPQTTLGGISTSAIGDIDLMLKGSTACLIGCGLTVNEDTKQIVEYVISNAECSLVIDADAITCIAKDLDVLKKAKKPVIITPHMAEMARLTGQSIADINLNPFETADTFSKEYNAIVILKGHNTIITTPSGEMYENTTGNAGLAKGGSGDVLSGMIAALLAQGMIPQNAAACAVYLHGMTADSLSDKMSQYSMLARDLIEEIPFTLKKLEQ